MKIICLKQLWLCYTKLWQTFIDSLTVNFSKEKSYSFTTKQANNVKTKFLLFISFSFFIYLKEGTEDNFLQDVQYPKLNLILGSCQATFNIVAY